jgi:hypothetical protein
MSGAKVKMGMSGFLFSTKLDAMGWNFDFTWGQDATRE